jgi:hypothetical protein
MYSRLSELGDQLGSVRERMKSGRTDPEKCHGVKGFTERHWRWLEEYLKPNDAAPSGR